MIDTIGAIGNGVVSAFCLVTIMSFAPVVSVVAVPIFAIRASFNWVEHRSLYNRTLTDQTRAKFGRIEGQDYTQWNGKAVKQVNPKLTGVEHTHRLGGVYPFIPRWVDSYLTGGPDATLSEEKSGYTYKNTDLPSDYPFSTKNDLEWLNIEFKRREIKELLDTDLQMLRIFSKDFIPLFGFIWVFLTETCSEGAMIPRCQMCMKDGEGKYWGWREAITFHRENAKQRSIST